MLGNGRLSNVRLRPQARGKPLSHRRLLRRQARISSTRAQRIGRPLRRAARRSFRVLVQGPSRKRLWILRRQARGTRPATGPMHAYRHAHARAQARARTQARTHTDTHTHTHAHARAHTCTRAKTHAHRHTDTQTHTHTRALTNQALGERGPQESPSNATAQFGEWAYRVCRMGESPWELRKPPEHIHDLTRPQLRGMILSAVAKGNDPQMPSPFLHASTSIAVIRQLLGERRWLYSNWLVRWPKDCVGPARVDFQCKTEWGWVLEEWDTDTDYLQECLQKARGYATKDRELVYLTSIPVKEIDWWCERTNQWRSVEDTIAWKPDSALTEPPPRFRGRPFPAATSQAGSSQVEAKSPQASIQ